MTLNREKLLELARKSGAEIFIDDISFTDQELQRFAALLSSDQTLGEAAELKQRLKKMHSEYQLLAERLERERNGAIEPKITIDELTAFNRFCECREDSDADGYDVPKDKMKRLAQIGLVRTCGFGCYETTVFGDAVRDRSLKRPLQAQEPSKPQCCNQCPHDVGDAYQRDCAYPDCMQAPSKPVDTTPDDLAMLVRRLVRKLEQVNPGTDLAAQALDYLRRKGLQGSPLRDESSKPVDDGIEAGPIDANRLEQLAKERPDECFLKGSGVLKLIGAIRQLEAQIRELSRAQTKAEAPEVTPEMVNAYLDANNAYWREQDALPLRDPRKWRNGTPQEATEVSLRAALAAAPQQKEGKDNG